MLTKRGLNSIILIFSFSIVAFSQSLEETFELAETFQASGNHDAAIETYLRVIFFDEEEIFVKDALLNTANLYFVEKDYTNAALYYQRAGAYYEQKASIPLFQQKVNAYLSAHLYQSAKEELLYFNKNDFSTDDHLKTYFFQYGVAHYGLKEYDQAEAYFAQLIDSENNPDREKLARIIKKVQKSERKSIAAAFYMSAVIPGLGQFYAEDWRNGLNSFLLSGGLIAAGIYTAYIYTPLDAFLVVFPWWSRYHLGGMYGADQSVRQYKVKKRHQYYLEIEQLLQPALKDKR